MRNLNTKLLAGFVMTSLLCMGSAVRADDDDRSQFKARLTGYEEVPPVSTGASGRFRARIADDQGSIDFELTYGGIEGGNVLFAHIHVGQRGVNGGVSAFFCGGGGRPACPTPGGTVTGTILPANVLGPGGAQQIPPGALNELIAAMRAGVTYANVHSTVSPGGEIRGQVRGDDDD
jgi:CHRD domain-containing protein